VSGMSRRSKSQLGCARTIDRGWRGAEGGAAGAARKAPAAKPPLKEKGEVLQRRDGADVCDRARGQQIVSKRSLCTPPTDVPHARDLGILCCRARARTLNFLIQSRFGDSVRVGAHAQTPAVGGHEAASRRPVSRLFGPLLAGLLANPLAGACDEPLTLRCARGRHGAKRGWIDRPPTWQWRPGTSPVIPWWRLRGARREASA
jgi:hypothetical protein